MYNLIIADIHGNKEALKEVLLRCEGYNIKRVILLGDIIDYGPHSNEVIDMLKTLDGIIVCNIRGNHEDAIINSRYEKFSSERGRISARYTKKILTKESWNYLNECIAETGKLVINIGNKKCLAIHGSLQDEYWKSIDPSDELAEYEDFDYVFSGHSHIPHVFEKYYTADNIVTRNKKKTVFINPGSVGQPRNLSTGAHFCLWDDETEEVLMGSVNYDIKKEQQDFSDEVDSFYKNRLEVGV